MKTNVAPVRGMRDLLPQAVELRDHATAVILATYRRFGFRRVETPVLEHAALLTSGQGGDNEKLIYRVLKRGEKLDLATARSVDDVSDLGLRYDLTVPLARFYAHNRGQLPDPFKAVQIGSVWRAERPQKGRYRQFTQCDIDVLGSAGALAEIELIAATMEALQGLGLAGFTVRVNDRAWLEAVARAAGVPEELTGRAFIVLDKLDKIGAGGVADELLGLGLAESSVKHLAPLLEGEGEDGLTLEQGAALSDDPLARAALERLELILSCVASAGDVSVRFDPSLVRGMGYYTGPIFEVGLEGYGFSLAGGGRYDRMIGGMVGQDVPACGFSIGFERVLLVLEEQGLLGTGVEGLVALLHGPDDPPERVLAQATALRAAGRAVSVLPRRKKLGRQLDELAGQGFSGFAPVGEGQNAPEVKPLGS